MDTVKDIRVRELLRSLLKPGVLLAAAYAIAICFERTVQVEVFKPYRLIGAALILFVIVRARIGFNRFAILAVSFILTGFVLALIGSSSSSNANSGLFQAAALWAFNVATYVALFNVLRLPKEIVAVALVHALAVLVAANGIAAQASADASGELGVSLRLFGDFKNPANACVSMLFCSLVLLTALRISRRPGHPLRRIMGLCASAVLISYMIYVASLTGSRAGAALIVVGLFVYFMMSQLRGAAMAIALAAVLLLTIEVVAPGGIERTVAELSGKSVLVSRVKKKGLDTDRLYLWRAGFDAFLDSYGLGVGMATYPTLHRQYFAKYASRSDQRWMKSNLTLHNDAVSALVEFGLVGFLLFGAMCIELVRAAKEIRARYVRPIFYALLVGMAVNGLSHTGLAYFSVWFYFALMFAWLRYERQARVEPAFDPRPAAIDRKSALFPVR